MDFPPFLCPVQMIDIVRDCYLRVGCVFRGRILIDMSHIEIIEVLVMFVFLMLIMGRSGLNENMFIIFDMLEEVWKI